MAVDRAGAAALKVEKKSSAVGAKAAAQRESPTSDSISSDDFQPEGLQAGKRSATARRKRRGCACNEEEMAQAVGTAAKGRGRVRQAARSDAAARIGYDELLLLGVVEEGGDGGAQMGRTAAGVGGTAGSEAGVFLHQLCSDTDAADDVVHGNRLGDKVAGRKSRFAGAGGGGAVSHPRGWCCVWP